MPAVRLGLPSWVRGPEIELGAEHDQVLTDAVLDELRKAGAKSLGATWVPDLDGALFLVKGRKVRLTAETYMGLRIKGPAALIEPIAARAMERRSQLGPCLDDLDYSGLFTFYGGKPRAFTLERAKWEDKRKGIREDQLAVYLDRHPEVAEQWKSFLGVAQVVQSAAVKAIDDAIAGAGV